MKRTIAILIGITLLATVGITANAETLSDPTGDVWHWNYTDAIWNMKHVSRSDIDITEISYTTSGEQVILSLKVGGLISDSELVTYTAHVNTSDSTYMLMWNSGEGFGLGSSTEEGSYQMDFDPVVTVNGDTISATFDIVGTFSTGIELWGFVTEYSELGNGMTAEWWGDWAPDDNDPYFGQNSDDDDDDTTPGDDDDDDTTPPTPPTPPTTPGFEILTLIAAIGIALIALRKRK